MAQSIGIYFFGFLPIVYFAVLLPRHHKYRPDEPHPLRNQLMTPWTVKLNIG